MLLISFVPTALMLLVRNNINTKAKESYLVSLGEVCCRRRFRCRRFPSRG